MVIRTLRLTVCLLALALASATAFAQNRVYRCQSGNGGVQLQATPCDGSSGPTLRAYGANPQGASHSYVPVPPRAPDVQGHVPYLNRECSSLSEGLRTAATRGVDSATNAVARREYSDKCADNEADARRAYQEDQGVKRAHQQEQRKAVVAQQSEAKRSQEGCAAMRDLISIKRKRESSLNPTEVAALRNSEATYNERCIAR